MWAEDIKLSEIKTKMQTKTASNTKKYFGFKGETVDNSTLYKCGHIPAKNSSTKSKMMSPKTTSEMLPRPCFLFFPLALHSLSTKDKQRHLAGR